MVFIYLKTFASDGLRQINNLSMSHDGNKFIQMGDDYIYVFEKGATSWAYVTRIPCEVLHAACISSDGRYIMAGQGTSSKAIMVCRPNFT